jgi:glycosyltransferase involved in cell wall biosynthesis
MISTYNLMDFGRRGIQFIADFSFNDNVRRELDSLDHGLRKWFYRSSPLRRMYLGLGRRMNGGNPDAWKMNVTIANSAWTQKVFHERYNIESHVIYPPVPGKFPEVDWKKKEDGFVYIGRISPEKRIEELVHILDRVRNKGMNIHFHIYGKLGNNYYARKIQQLCKQKRDWIFLECVVMGDQKLRALSQHKYGISGCKFEAFGISVAEMIKAGCITWVPDAGGQVEIVNTPELTYKDSEEAFYKIGLILRSNDHQNRIRNHLLNLA